MPNALTRDVGFKVGPVLLEVLAKHYFEKRKEDGSTAEPVKLRKDEILFDEAFNLVKSFLNTASWHTVEDLQAFSNTRTPSPPWVKVVRLFVPMSSCDEAATHLIRVLGGKEFCRQLVGGIKWWQVRGLPGVDGQWIVAKKDWREAKKKEKIPTQKQSQSTTDSSEEEEGIYNKDMDAMRCILFLHGGGFYFGSVDQERYSIQRLARKINGRVFAINYRLAPQYPFPCALQDALAAYLYLIRPPPGSPHTPVDPAHIVVAGDSAGGALSLALLQLVRDAGLPAPAGGLLISPWCDLTHSFPSIHLNTSTDVIPDCGLSFHKPSTLWPPPSEEVSSRVHASLRHRIRQAFKLDGPAPYNPTDTVIPQHDHTDSPTVPPTLSTFSPDKVPVHVGSTTHLPLPSESDGGRKICITTEKNERLEIDRQIHFYTENTLLTHPLISTSLSYLGGLPPLFIITGDKEVLRDEGIYSAHKAANPHKFPISDSVKKIYPPFRNLRSEDMIPTSVHLQVYDDAPHVLPILFAFTTPAKFCFRSMAAFTKFVTNMSLPPPVLPLPAYVSTSPAPSISDKTGDSESGANSKTPSLMPESNPPSRLSRRLSRSLSFKMPTMLRHRSMSSTFRRTSDDTPGSPGLNSVQLSPRRGQFEWPSSPSSSILVPPSTSSLSPVNGSEEADVGGPRFGVATTHVPTRGEHTAGEPSTYSHIKDFQKWECGIIRERVGIDGVIRPLEPENELLAMQVPIEIIGNMSELTLRRCIDYQGRFDKKFAHTYKQVEKHRRRNLERSKQDTIKQLSNLRQTIISKDAKAGESRGNSEVNVSTGGQPNGDKGRSGSGDSGFKELLLSTPGWSWAWALDEHENPPPSSIVSRRDTEEARKLAESADLALLGQEHTFSGNNLWSVVVNFLTITPGKAKVSRTPGGVVNPGTEQEDKEDKPGSRFSLSRVFKTDQQAQKAGKA